MDDNYHKIPQHKPKKQSKWDTRKVYLEIKDLQTEFPIWTVEDLRSRLFVMRNVTANYIYELVHLGILEIAEDIKTNNALNSSYFRPGSKVKYRIIPSSL